MAYSWQQSDRTGYLQTRLEGHTTSVNLAKQQRYNPSALAGVKRHSDGLENVGSLAHGQGAAAWPPAPPPIVQVPKNRLTASVITRVEANTENLMVASTPDSLRHRSTPGPSQHPLLSLRHPRYALSQRLVSNLEHLGVHSIYPWQSSCLLGKGLLDGRQNLIYTAPTGGGKSLVADVLMLKRIIEEPTMKALLVLPYVALVQEKTKWLRRVVDGVGKSTSSDGVGASTPQWSASSQGIRIAGFFGGSKAQITWNDCDVAVCTIEKANSLINSAIEDGTVGELGVVVLDELHMLDDQHRGYIMELMITKLLCLQATTQIVGMSATMSNPKMLADWLQAKFYVSKYRPIPIEEHLVYDNRIYSTADSNGFLKTAGQLVASGATQKPLNPSHVIATSDCQELKSAVSNAVVALAVDTARSGYGALIFCSSRQGSQAMAALISDAMPSDLAGADMVNKRLDVLASLQALPGGFESTFTKTVSAGVGFHHAGLTVEERELIAEAYDAGILKIMVATCSLAAGINLPARRVILNGARMGRELVGPAMLRQMRGRAGRKGKDEIGETYLCCQKEELEAVAELLEAELPAVASCLTPEKRGVKRAILEIVATRLASSYESLQEYVHRSLLWQTSDHANALQLLHTAVQSLVADGLIQMVTDNAYAPTRLGSAIVASSLTPEDGIFVHSDLRRALSSFVMDSELHIFYLFTPIPQPSPSSALTSEISWPVFRTLLDTLDESSLRVLHLIGISPALVNHMANSGSSDLKESTPQELYTARIYRRMYTTFALRDLCNEVPINTISLKYNMPRGTIQNLAQTCHGFAAGMIKFCRRMSSPLPPSPPPSSNINRPVFTSPSSSTLDPNAAGFSMLSVVLEHMQDRLRAGARADLLEMAQVTFVKGRMARLLYESGFKGIKSLADADPRTDILPVMMSVSGWKARPRNGEDAIEHEVRRVKLQEKLLTKAEILVASAAKLWERDVLSAAVLEEE